MSYLSVICCQINAPVAIRPLIFPLENRDPEGQELMHFVTSEEKGIKSNFPATQGGGNLNNVIVSTLF